MAETIDNEASQTSATAVAIPAASIPTAPSDMTKEEVDAREKARRYRLRFIDLKTEEPAYHLIHELPVEMMVRHSFFPMERDGDTLYVAMADPTNLEVIY